LKNSYGSLPLGSGTGALAAPSLVLLAFISKNDPVFLKFFFHGFDAASYQIVDDDLRSAPTSCGVLLDPIKQFITQIKLNRIVARLVAVS
jgi:hypothetical protein